VSGGTQGALHRIAAPSLILAPPLDLFNPAESAREAANAIPGARFVEIPSVQGHLAASAQDPRDAAFLNGIVGAFLRDEP
jgi:homoserine O-acetyltransferase